MSSLRLRDSPKSPSPLLPVMMLVSSVLQGHERQHDLLRKHYSSLMKKNHSGTLVAPVSAMPGPLNQAPRHAPHNQPRRGPALAPQASDCKQETACTMPGCSALRT